MKEKYRYLFGPVPSRRFGRSLGIDLTPYKTCCFDCVFCQLGRTPEKTVIRKEYVPIDSVLHEINDWIKADGNADYITLSGSGEPTLHSEFGKVLEFVKQSSIPSVLLTNGALLHLPEVRNAASYADVVKVSLSAWDQRSFEWVNRPHYELKFSRMIEGHKVFRDQFKGELWIEVFLVSGINTMPDNVEKIAEFIKQIKPNKIHLNTVVRPPAEDFAAPLPKNNMEALANLFEPKAEVISEFSSDRSNDIKANEATIFAMLQRRPCTIEHIAQGFGMHINEVSKYLGNLMRKNEICMKRKDNTVYYVADIRNNGI